MKEIQIISSKSEIHRYLIGAMLAEIGCGKVPELIYNNESKDVRATEVCVAEILHAAKNKEDDTEIVLNCGESGSTLRFLLPIVGALGLDAEFILEGKLGERPLEPLVNELMAHGMTIEWEKEETQRSPYTKVCARGSLESGNYKLAGNVSSQFISGLLMALPILQGDSTLRVEGKTESAPYIEMTLAMAGDFGLEIAEDKASEGSCLYHIRGNQVYSKGEKWIAGGDWSNGAFFLAAGLIGDEPIKVMGLDISSTQGDKGIIDYLKAFGGKLDVADDGIIAYPSELRGIEIDGSQNPDLVPVLALIGIASKGITRITNAKRLRYKESDRLNAIAQVLKTIGGDIEELTDGLIIRGLACSGENTVGGRLKGGEVSSQRDHRIAMMATVASLISEEPVIIKDRESVNKSYPGFYDIFI